MDLSIKNDTDVTIGGGITNNGSGNVHITNQGTINKDPNGNHITNNGNSGVHIDDWIVFTDQSLGKLDTVIVSGSSTGNVNFDKVTVDQSGLDLKELEDLNNIISGVKNLIK